ncbi:MAG: polyphosphate kinase 1 [Deltaproteobacteria bacterium]|nr:polyphosphate kinase 1 [Deltaproteobacteria bacterium]
MSTVEVLAKARAARGERENGTGEAAPSVGDGAGARTAAADAAVTTEPRPQKIDLQSPEFYLNRELTWLAFNSRVLHEAEDPRNPVLERLKFLAIVSANLDEFFMKRIGGLKQQEAAGVRRVTVDGMSPGEQIEASYAIVHGLDRRRAEIFDELRRLLRKHDIRLVSIDHLEEREREALREVYLRTIHPLVTPQAMDPAHPFPFVSNLSLNLLVMLRYEKDADHSLARVKVPIGAGVPRWIRVGHQDVFVPLEDVIAENLDVLFPGMQIESRELFRVTRNANTERDEEDADDLLALIESELRERKFAPVVRMEIGTGMSPQHRGMLASELGLDEVTEVTEVKGRLGLADLHEIAGLNRPELRDPTHHPIDSPELTSDRNIFHVIRDAGSILLQHPYESFTSSVERFLYEAATDPKVRAVKMTLYRTSAESKVIEHLIEAARNGKQVAVVVELKARFDEHSNIQWASRLEEYGIHVTYGVVGLKTHCKVILVVRQDYSGLRRYAHIGTGNYHSGTARIYADLGLLTSDESIGEDLTELFNYLTTGYKPRRQYHRLLVAPTTLKQGIISKIEREVEHHRAGRPSRIQMKMNALEDADVTLALYRASQAGVKIDLVVRDTCRLRPGLPGISETVQVVSIVGRFLEHMRIFHFANGGKPEYWIGSADCMKRNLESRVEVLCPVDDPRHQEELQAILDLQLDDRRSAWEMRPDGRYVQRRPTKEKHLIGSQQILIERAEKRLRSATRLRRRKPKGFARRTFTT